VTGEGKAGPVLTSPPGRTSGTRPPHLTRMARAWKWWPVDAAVWALSVVVAVWVRFDFSVLASDLERALVFALIAVALHAVLGAVIGMYTGRFLLGSFDEAVGIAFTGAGTGAMLLLLAFVLSPDSVPRSTPLTATAMAIVGMLAARFVGRAWTSSRRARRPETAKVIVFGAGNGANQLVRHMQSDRSAGWRPVALLDDDPRKRRLQVAGVRVRGTRVDIARVAEQTRSSTLVIAIPSADSDVVRDVTRRAEAAGLHVMVLPPLEQLVRRRVGSDDLRDINVTDLLGRQPVTLDEAAITAQVADRRVLVTGAGGSIGAELCRQIHRFGPAELVMLDRDESALHAVQLSLYGRAMLDGFDTVLSDIRDAQALDRLFAERRPQIVFHAAALKHLPLLETYPQEAWKTNVVGTHHVLQSALRHGVETFVNISTDKAADPISVLGFSKRVAERMTADAARRGAGKYVSVRFGNVLGSRGSVLTAFERQIAEGGPLTVTHPDVTRYFMTISEACQLVLQAAVSGSSGEALVLDMGSPIKIMEVAELLIDRASSRGVEVVFTGLRPGEKLHEDLFGADEPHDVRPVHRLIFHVPVAPLAIEHAAVDVSPTAEQVRQHLRVLAGLSAAGGRAQASLIGPRLPKLA